MARTEGFAYNGYVVGGASPTATTQVVGERFGWVHDAQEGSETSEFVCDFILVGSDAADLETKTSAMLAALRTKYQALSVDWGSNNVASYDPAVATATGWDGMPSVAKSQARTRSTGLTRGFTFRLRVNLPSTYTDPNLAGNPAAGGRRTSSVALRYTSDSRRVVTINGIFHEVPTKLPRALTTTAALNNPTGPIDTYCVARLAKIDAAAQWTIMSRSEDDNNQQTVMAFRREYCETIAGRYVATPDIAYLPSRLRMVSVRGVFYRTYSAAYNGSSTKAASVNYADNATGGYAYAVAQLAALTAAQGGALTVGTDCELISEKITPNDQDDRCDYNLIFRELQFKQSTAAGSKDDPDITVDQIVYTLHYEPLNDSTFQPGAGGGPDPFKATPALAGAAGGKPGSTQAPSSLDKSVVPPQDPQDNPKTGGGLLPTKPVHILIHYRATLAKTVLDPRTKWYSAIRPWLLGQWSAELGFSPTYLMDEMFEENAQTNEINALVEAVALPGDLIAYRLEEAVDDDLAISADKAFTGTAYEYLLQQLPPERRKVRRHTAVFKTGGTFDPSQMLTQSNMSGGGYVVMRRSAPRISTTTVGIPNNGDATQQLTGVTFDEFLLYVGRNVGKFGSVPNGAPTSSPRSVSPTNPGGK